jgi:tetratricopeptide (TPR) repeat protein
LAEGVDAGQNAARLKMLREIDANLEKIVTDYPGSALAVDLVSTGTAGKLSREQVKLLSSALTERIECLAAPDAWKGRWIQSTLALALETADSKVDPPARFEDLAEVAKAQASVGDKAGALKSVSTALEMVTSIEQAGGLGYGYLRIAEAQAVSGDIAGAFETMRAIDDAGRRASVLAKIAEAQAAAGDIAGALETVSAIYPLDNRAVMLANIAKSQVSNGDIAGAHATVRKALEQIKGFREKGFWTPALTEVAGAQVAVNDISGARATLATVLRTAKTLPDGASRDYAMAMISEAQALAGDSAGAIATAKTVETAELRVKALASVSKAQVVAGDIAGALETSTFEDAAGRAIILANIAKAQAANGDVAKARESIAAAVEAVKDGLQEREWLDVARAVAGAQAVAGETIEALKTVTMIKISFVPAPVLAEIAKAQAADGGCAGASEAMTLAIDSVETSEVSEFRVSILNEIVRALNLVN